jgi:hypothetical protein
MMILLFIFNYGESDVVRPRSYQECVLPAELCVPLLYGGGGRI